MTEKYILNDSGDPEPCNDLMEWGRFMEKRDVRIIAKDALPHDVRVSTVFLGLDHAFGGAVPILWETMIFNGPHDGHQERYTSRADALAGHARAVALATTPVAHSGRKGDE